MIPLKKPLYAPGQVVRMGGLKPPFVKVVAAKDQAGQEDEYLVSHQGQPGSWVKAGELELPDYESAEYYAWGLGEFYSSRGPIEKGD
jgi:hypothetical protein